MLSGSPEECAWRQLVLTVGASTLVNRLCAAAEVTAGSAAGSRLANEAWSGPTLLAALNFERHSPWHARRLLDHGVKLDDASVNVLLATPKDGSDEDVDKVNGAPSWSQVVLEDGFGEVARRLVDSTPRLGPPALVAACAAFEPRRALDLLESGCPVSADVQISLTHGASSTAGGGNCWDTSDAGPWATIGGDDGCTITSKKSSPSGQNGLVRAKHGYSKGVHKWEIRVDSKDGGGDGYHAIGVATKNSTQTFKKWECGEGFYGIYLDGNFKISKAGKQSYGGLKWNVGTVWEVTLDMDKGELSFAYDGTSQGVAFTGLCGMELFPALAVGALNKNVYTARNMTLPATIMQQLLARDSCLTLVAKLVEMRPEMAAETFSAAALVDALKTGRFRCAAFLLERKAPIDPGLLLDGGADKCMWRTLVLNSSSACRSLVETICDASPALKAAADCSKTLMAAIVARSSATCMWLLDRGVKLDETELLESNSMAPSVEEKFAFTKSSIGGQVTLSDGGALAQSHAKKGYACVPIALHGQCSWEVTLVDDKEGDQTTCFGVSTQLTGDQLMSYDTCKSVHVVRSYNGAVSSGDQARGLKRLASCTLETALCLLSTATLVRWLLQSTARAPLRHHQFLSVR